MQVGRYKFRFSTGREVSGLDALPPIICPHAKVVRIHERALVEEYTVSSTILVVVEVCLSYVRLTSALLVCAIVEPTATMHAQSYAGRRIKSGSC